MTRHAHTTNVRPHRAIRIAIATALIGAAAVATAPAASAAQAARPTVVTGTWTDADPLTITGSTPLGAAVLVDAIGSSHWSGSLVGNTSFTLQALIAPDGSTVGHIDETFDGAVAGLGAGELRLHESFTQAPNGAITITAASISGTGALASAHATLRFTGQTDATGVGGGRYNGLVVA